MQIFTILSMYFLLLTVIIYNTHNDFLKTVKINQELTPDSTIFKSLTPQLLTFSIS